MFAISPSGLLIQFFLAGLGYAWMYYLTGMPRASLLAAVPCFALNIEYALSHQLCEALDVFVSCPYPVTP